jgi:phenylalanyl-tRNA synthetase beta chain
MKVTLKWLREYVDIDTPLDEVCEKLTAAGLEVADIRIIGGWKNVIIGQITAVNPHPNADRLRLATLNLGTKEQTVVCGAPNLNIGDKIAFASVGAELRDGHTGELAVLKPAKIRGVLSEGMVCSEKELDISDDHTKIIVLPADAPVGTDLSDYMGDTVIDIDITPNRPDCLSVLGIAREIAALTGGKIKEPDAGYKEGSEDINKSVSVKIKAPEFCPRYCASLLTNVKLTPSPQWMQQRLLACGMRPINNIVDITNYVMLEYGQPLHAFDFKDVKDSKIIVRRAREEEEMRTLDGVDRKLNSDMLVIADGQRAVAVAGIMGGEGSEVNDNTNTVLIESANFNQAVIHKGSIELKLSSEASLRFEKGLSRELPMKALKRATYLMQELTGGEVARGIVDVYPGEKTAAPVLLPAGEVKRLLGIDLSAEKIVKMLESLGFECDKAGIASGKLTVNVPWWRTDINCAADLVEEVARMYGYDNIPMTMLSSSLTEGGAEPIIRLREKIREILVSCGFQEILTYSLTSKEINRKLAPDLKYEGPEPVKISHPMSHELECLRTELRSSVLATLARNQRYQQKNIRFFELGRIFLPVDGKLPDEKEKLCVMMGSEQEEQFWRGQMEEVDFFIVKGILETLLNKLGISPDFAMSKDVSFMNGKSADVIVDNEAIGVVGQLHPKVTAAFDINGAVYMFDLDVQRLLELTSVSYNFSSPPKYPGVSRDIALLIDDSIAYKQVYDIIRGFALVQKVSLFDIYQGEQVSAGKKSLAIRILYQAADHTLTDVEIDKIQKNMLEKLKREFSAELRS